MTALPWLRILAAACAALAIACVILLLWGRAGYASADRWQARAGIEADNHRQTKANFRTAQDAAVIAARAARLAAEQTSRRLAERADHEDFTAARSAADRFAVDRRLPVGSGGAAIGAPSNARAASQADVAARGDGPGADAVVLTRAEFDQLVGNTLRLEVVRRWGEQLINEGLAIPADQKKED